MTVFSRITPISFVCFVVRARAVTFALYFAFSAAARIVFLVSSLSLPVPFSALETVGAEYPVILAKSYIVIIEQTLST